jgi:two-component system, CitB family, sensor kinase
VLVRPSAVATGGLRIEVSDSGPGPAPEIADRLFELGRTTKAGDSRGIGLALVRQAAERLGGTVELSEGVFVVELPAAVPA